MANYIYLQNNILNGCGQCKCLNEGVLNLEVEQALYNAYSETPSMYIWDGTQIVIDPDYEAKQAQAEAERIALLYLTGADVERGIYQAKGMDFEDILEMVETLVFADATQVQGIDVKALRIELKANHFYRGNPYVTAVGTLLGFTGEQLDKFFEDGDYKHLLPPVDDTEMAETVEPIEEV